MSLFAETLHKKISEKIISLKDNPRPPGCIKLHGVNGYRLRIGNYRIIYTIEDSSATVTICAVAHRREAYR